MPHSDLPDYARSIHHDGSSRYVRSTRVDPHLGDELNIRLRSGLDAPIERVLLRICPDGEQQLIEMTPEDDRACRWWQATLKLSMPMVSYRFLLLTSDSVWWYNGCGLHRHVPTDADDFRLLADYAAPTWVRDSVFYQVFPDSFADGDPASNVRDGEFTYGGYPSRAKQWGEPPTRAPLADMVEFYGGDLPGIEQHLDDLTGLGVNALYLNPVFTAYSNHRYDVVDYFNVDPHLGGNAALASLRSAMRERGMHLMLDVVPNHCGVLHPWFQTAVKDANAPEAEYFTFNHHPDDYATWLGVRSLPKFNYQSAALREAMYAGPDSVFRYWLRPPYSADGWRIDVANMLARQGANQLGLEIGRGVRRAVKAENPAAYLLGENFFDGAAQLQGDCWDAVMNYAGFANPVWYWLGKFYLRQHSQPHLITSDIPWSTQALVETWQAFRAAIPWVVARQQFNLISSHDVPRVRAAVERDAARNRLAAALLMTYVGVPNVYYGDEVGLGRDLRDTRLCMPWDRSSWDHELRAFYQTLIHLRRTAPALIEGGFQVLLVEDDALTYLRDTDEDWIIVVGQRGPGTRPASRLPIDHAAIPNGVEFVEWMTGQRATTVNGHLPLPALPPGPSIWRARL